MNCRNLASNDLRHLNASMLSGHLDSLRSLSFYDNQIACISSGTFDMLPQLLTLYVNLAGLDHTWPVFSTGRDCFRYSPLIPLN